MNNRSWCDVMCAKRRQVVNNATQTNARGFTEMEIKQKPKSRSPNDRRGENHSVGNQFTRYNMGKGNRTPSRYEKKTECVAQHDVYSIVRPKRNFQVHKGLIFVLVQRYTIEFNDHRSWSLISRSSLCLQVWILCRNGNTIYRVVIFSCSLGTYN